MTFPETSEPLRGLRILLVEDDALIAMDTACSLKNIGASVVGPCQTVSQALTLLNTIDCCDAAILDANLRNETAVPVAKALTSRAIPYIVVTGYSREQLPPELTLGPIFVKPVAADELVTELQRILNV